MLSKRMFKRTYWQEETLESLYYLDLRRLKRGSGTSFQSLPKSDKK